MQQALLESKEKAAQLIEFKQEAAAITRALKDAGMNFEMERLQFEYDEKKSQVNDLYDDFVFSVCSEELIDTVKSEYQSNYQPSVLKEAKQRFSKFTNYQYELIYDEEDGIKGFDTKHQQYYNLSQLSLGTRMQLLLATRMAWLNKLEERIQGIPLFLDEALTTTDEDRYQLIVDSLQRISDEENRQIVYLSARYQELDFWAHTTNKKIIYTWIWKPFKVKALLQQKIELCRVFHHTQRTLIFLGDGKKLDMSYMRFWLQQDK